MKKDYLQTLPKPTDIKNEAYNAYYGSVQKIFAQLQKNYNRESCQQLLQQIKKTKDVRQLKKAHKKPIYEFFLKRELQTLDYIKGQDSLDYKIMKLTKCRLDGFKIDWKNLWERILVEVPETAGNNSKLIESFIKHVKLFFDQNNAIEVWKYFQSRNYKDLSKAVNYFVRISSQTKQSILNDFVLILVRSCEVKIQANSQFIMLFLWVERNRKQLSLPKQAFAFLNNTVLQFILAHGQSSSKKSVQSKLDSASAQLLQKSLGKSNPGSVELLQTIFSFVKKFVKPLENSTKSVMFIYWLIKAIFLRVQKQKKTKQKLLKLIQKMQTKKPEEENIEDQQQQVQQKVLEGKQYQKSEKKNLKQEKEDEQNQQEQQQDEEDQQDQQQQQLEQLMLMSGTSQLVFEKDDDTNEKGDTDEEKKQKMQKILANQITEEILDCLQKQIQEIFEVIYYVNSKKTISHLLRYIFRLFPKLIIKSFDVLDKASTIPNINEDGLVKNFTVAVEHMFMEVNYKEGIKNVIRVLEKAYNSRRIVDVWYIYQSIGSKIPMLDQKDLQTIPDADKELFQKTFGLNHDRFYEQYSDHMLQAFKRLLRQSQFLQKSQYKTYGTTMQQTYFNSYPAMRKQILQQVMQVINEKPNSLAFLYFLFAQLPQRQYEILKNQFVQMNEQNKDTEQLRVQMLGVLSKNMSLQELKPYIRKMAQKGHFKIIQSYAIHRSVEQIKWQPLKTTLNYLYEDPKITVQFQLSTEQRKKCLKQLQKYRDQLLIEAAKQIQHIKQDQTDSVSQIIIKSYTTPSKVATLSKRKKIYEILSIVGIINAMMEQKLIDIKNQKKLQLVDSQVAPYEFLNVNKEFSKYIKKLLSSQEVLHDPKLISILNAILTGGYFMYHDIQTYEEKKLTKERKKNKNHEAPECVNRIIYGNQYISLARNYMGLLLHKTHGGCIHDIKGKADELFILSMINTNETYKDIRSMFQQSKMIPEFRKYLIDLMKHKVQNRELIKRISSTIDFITKSQVCYIPFSDQEIIEFVSYHTALMQSLDSKVKQNAIKSFRKFSKIIVDNPISDSLTQAMLKYSKMDKMEMVWAIYVAALMGNPHFVGEKALTQKRIVFLLQNVQKLILHDSRSLRRVSLYLYAALIRKLKKINAEYQIKNFESVPYKEKSLQQFLQYGFIRHQYYDVDFKDRSAHKKHPIQIYEIKKEYSLPPNIFDILIKNENNANKFVKNFHSDLASTTEMMISAMQSSIATVDLFGIATKAIQKLIYFFKTRDLSVSRNQLLVGGKFFRYLCIQDAKQGYKFFHAVKDFVLSCLTNMESLDNQTLVILYAYSLMNAYQTTFKERIPQIQVFLAKILKQIIKKSSKLIYTKLQTLFFKKIKNKKAIQFIVQMCQEMIQQNNKVFRAGYLLSTVKGKDFDTSKKVLKKMFDQRLQLEHQSNVFNTIYFMLAYPQNNMWNLQDIEKTKVINLDSLKKEGKLKQILFHYVMLTNKQLQNYLVTKIKQMLEDKEAQMTKTGFTILNNTIKSSSELYMDEQNSNFIVNLLNVWLKVVYQKKELQLDFESGYKAIDYLLGTKMLPPQIFQKFILTILQKLEPNKKSCDLLSSILNSPCNYIKISKQLFKQFTQKVLTLQSNSSLYKQLLQILSTFFRYRLQPFVEVSNIQTTNKNKRALLLQAYLLAENVDLKQQVVKQVLKISSKERKNIWAREMMVVRGQREYFDKQQTAKVWREIKALSNPYHYHA